MARDQPTADAPAELQRSFWLLVGLLNVAVLGIGIGVLLIGFERRLGAGFVSLGVGVGALAASYRRYRSVRRNA